MATKIGSNLEGWVHKAPSYWENTNNQRDFMTEIAKKLNINKMEDWYNVTAKQIQQLGEGSMLSHYNGSLSKALQTIYPDVQWNIRNFKCVPRGYWKDTKNQREFMTELATKLSVKKPEDWYNVTTKQVQQLGGGAMLKYPSHFLNCAHMISHYNGSLIEALQTVFPEVQWNIHNFKKVPRRYWNNKDNVNSFMTNLAKQMSFKAPSHWN